MKTDKEAELNRLRTSHDHQQSEIDELRKALENLCRSPPQQAKVDSEIQQKPFSKGDLSFMQKTPVASGTRVQVSANTNGGSTQPMFSMFNSLRASGGLAMALSSVGQKTRRLDDGARSRTIRLLYARWTWL